MSRRARRSAGRRRRRPWGLASGLLAAGLVVGLGLAWWRPGPSPSVSGTPRLVVDRTEIDLGYRRFDTPVEATFTLTNTGDGILTVTRVPRVRAVLGC